VRRNHLAKDDLDWLPERYRLLRGAIVSAVWTGIGGGFLALLWGAHFIYFGGKMIFALVPAGYWAGDRVSKGIIRARLGKLAHGKVDLARLSNEDDGELVHVRGRVRATSTIAGLVSSEPGVYRRTKVRFGDVDIIDEEAVDFQLVDDAGSAVAIEVEGARLLVHDPKLGRTAFPDRLFPLAQHPSARRMVLRYEQMTARGRRARLSTQACETMLRAGDEIEAVGYKARKVDPTIVDRMARETPMRATLRAGKDLPLILSVVSRRPG
jgi:hypothetical protein